MLHERSVSHSAWAARRTAGLARASDYTWERCADSMRKVYLDVATADDR